jgi:hypothetical protein
MQRPGRADLLGLSKADVETLQKLHLAIEAIYEDIFNPRARHSG